MSRRALFDGMTPSEGNIDIKICFALSRSASTTFTVIQVLIAECNLFPHGDAFTSVDRRVWIWQITIGAHKCTYTQIEFRQFDLSSPFGDLVTFQRFSGGWKVSISNRLSSMSGDVADNRS